MLNQYISNKHMKTNESSPVLSVLHVKIQQWRKALMEEILQTCISLYISCLLLEWKLPFHIKESWNEWLNNQYYLYFLFYPNKKSFQASSLMCTDIIILVKKNYLNGSLVKERNFFMHYSGEVLILHALLRKRKWTG
jgi:hypothetical protein